MPTIYHNDRSNARKSALRNGGTFIGPVDIDGAKKFAVSYPDADEAPARDINEDVAPLDLSAPVAAVQEAIAELLPPLPPIEAPALTPEEIAGVQDLNRQLAELAASVRPVEPPPGAADVMMQVRVFVPAEMATGIARKLANLASRGVEVINPVSGNRVSLVEPGAKAERSPAAAASKGERGERVNPTHQRLIAQMRQPEGLALDDIVEQTGWIESASRKFVWTLRNKKGVAVEVSKEPGRGVVYRLPALSIVEAA